MGSRTIETSLIGFTKRGLCSTFVYIDTIFTRIIDFVTLITQALICTWLVLTCSVLTAVNPVALIVIYASGALVMIALSTITLIGSCFVLACSAYPAYIRRCQALIDISASLVEQLISVITSAKERTLCVFTVSVRTAAIVNFGTLVSVFAAFASRIIASVFVALVALAGI